MNAGRKRNRTGQFIPSESAAEIDPEERDRKKQRQLNKKNIGSHLYDVYLDVCFLKGTTGDWVMSDGQVGPLAEIALKIFKASFLPHMKERCNRTRSRFFNFEEGKRQEDIKQEFIIDGNNPSGKKKRKRVFMGWRLPKLGWRSEVDSLHKFIDEAIAAKALRVSKSEAKDIMRNELLSCQRLNSETYYVGYPSQSKRSSIDLRSDATNTGQARCDEIDGTVESHPELNEDYRGDAEQEINFLTETERATVASINRLIETAKHNTKFFLLCRVADDMNDSLLECIAISLLQSCPEDLAVCDPLIVDALKYAKLRKQGAVNTTEFDEQRNRVRATAQMLKIIRLRTPHLLSYEQMQAATLPLSYRPSHRARTKRYDSSTQ